jgi:RNA polymerase sigma-70 factor (ECF subfamily)
VIWVICQDQNGTKTGTIWLPFSLKNQVARHPNLSLSAAFAVGRTEPACYAPEVRDEKAPPLVPEALDHIDALFRLARHLTGDDADAEDLVQETYARAHTKRSQFTAGTHVRAWLFRIMRNLFIDGYRRDRSEPAREALEDDAVSDAADPGDRLRGDDELERLRSVVARDIEAALRSLTVDARTIVLLDMEGFTETELADVLGCSIGTIKSRLSRARAKLRERLRDYAR